LKKEGIARVSDRIQNIRKDSGFEVTDKIKVHLQKNDILEEAVKGMWTILNQKH
jgi:isoleucyl-tRNA synthetase